jgi:hypothetical protein
MLVLQKIAAKLLTHLALNLQLLKNFAMARAIPKLWALLEMLKEKIA